MSAVCRTLGAVGVIALLAACEDDGLVPWPDGGPCWPFEATPGGQVQIGTGDITFQPMPEMVTIVKNASQSDPFIQVHSRIRGIPPGDPYNFFDPRNPRTKVSMMIPELNMTLGVECPGSLGYVPSPEPDAFDLVSSLRIGFGTQPLAEVNGKQALVTVEVVGANRLYAKDEKLVTLIDPP